MVRGGGIEPKGKSAHGRGQQCGDCWEEGSLRGLNCNGKNTIQIKLRKRKLTHLKYFLKKCSLKNNVSSILVDIHNNDKVSLYIFMFYFLQSIIKAESYPLPLQK